MGNGRNMKDASLIKSVALPDGAAAVVTDGIDTMNGPNGDFVAPMECIITAPALAVGELANDETIIYDIQDDDNSGFTSARDVVPSVLTQTGAGGAGAAAATKRVALPSDVQRYVRLKATNSDTLDASGEDAIFEVVW